MSPPPPGVRTTNPPPSTPTHTHARTHIRYNEYTICYRVTVYTPPFIAKMIRFQVNGVTVKLGARHIHHCFRALKTAKTKGLFL